MTFVARQKPALFTLILLSAVAVLPVGPVLDRSDALRT